MINPFHLNIFDLLIYLVKVSRALARGRGMISNWKMTTGGWMILVVIFVVVFGAVGMRYRASREEGGLGSTKQASDSLEDVLARLDSLEDEAQAPGSAIDTIKERLKVIESRLNVLDTLIEKLSWERIIEIELISDTTEITITGVDLDSDGAYNLILNLINPSSKSVSYSLYFNDDRDKTHYWGQFISVGENKKITHGRLNNAVFVTIERGESASIEATLVKGADELVRYLMSITRRTPDEIVLTDYVLAWTIPENVIRLDIEASRVSSIGSGSTLVLHKIG